jgi:hypothetical protein
LGGATASVPEQMEFRMIMEQLLLAGGVRGFAGLAKR